MSWSIEFIPFVPWPVLWALAGTRRRAARASVLALAPRRDPASRELRAAAARHRQSAPEAGGPRAAERRGRRRRRRQPEPDDRRPHRAHRGGPQGIGGAAQGLSQSRRALGALHLDLSRQRARRHHAVHRPRPGACRRAARPARRRDHDHRRRGARRAGLRRGPRFRCAGACASDRQARRIRPQAPGPERAPLRHRRQQPEHRGQGHRHDRARGRRTRSSSPSPIRASRR